MGRGRFDSSPLHQEGGVVSEEQQCNGQWEHDYRSTECYYRVCWDCDEHPGLDRCYCGWARDGGDGYQQLVEQGEQIEVEE